MKLLEFRSAQDRRRGAMATDSASLGNVLADVGVAMPRRAGLVSPSCTWTRDLRSAPQMVRA
jgi:hypothetical protein